MGAAESHIDFMRLRQLRRTEILDSGADVEFDRMARLTAQLCEKSGAAICFFETDRVWFKASHGPFNASHVHPKFTELLLADSRILVIENCDDHSRLANVEWAQGVTPPGSFAATPLTSGDGYIIGALCLFDENHGALTIDKIQVLEGLAREIDTMVAAFSDSLRPHQNRIALSALDRAGQAVVVASYGGDIRYTNVTAQNLFALDVKSLASRSFIHLLRLLEKRYSTREDFLAKQLLPCLLQASPDERRVLQIDAGRELKIERVALPNLDAIVFYFTESKLNAFIPLGQMAGSLIHELNGSLAIVVGLARQIASGEVAEANRAETDQRLFRSSSLVSQLMLSVRELFTESNPKNVTVDVSDCLKQAVELRSEALTREKIQLEMKATSVMTLGRPVQLMQVFSSLLKDSVVALRSSEEKAIYIDVNGEGDEIVVSYRDTRPGLTDEKKKLIFDYFNQADLGHADCSLPMALAEKMIRKHGGEVRLTPVKYGLALEFRLPKQSGT